MENKPVIPISEFNKGGLADSKWSGVANSFYKLTGVDLTVTVASGLTQFRPYKFYSYGAGNKAIFSAEL